MNEISNSTLKVDTIPTVSTSNATDIGLYSATCGSNITSHGGQ